MDNEARGLAGLLDDSALWVKLPALQAELPSLRPEVPSFVRFLPGSAFPRDFDLPPVCTGEVQDRWMRGAVERLGVVVDGVGHSSGVPAQEVKALLKSPTLP